MPGRRRNSARIRSTTVTAHRARRAKHASGGPKTPAGGNRVKPRHRTQDWARFACVGIVVWIISLSAMAQQPVGPYVPPDVGGPGEAAPAMEAAPAPEGKGWIFVPSFGVTEIVTDNVRQTASSQQADLV